MTRVVWTFKAIRNLNAIRTYIGQFSPLAAQRMALRLLINGEGLVDFPERGMPISDGRRQLTTTPPYLLRYRVEGEVVTILEVRHAAEDAA